MITVERAVKLPKENKFAADAPPAGFPFLVLGETEKILEPVLIYLLAKHARGKGARWNRNSADADAYDLRDWFDFLEVKRKAWDVATEEDYIDYSDALQDIISVQTGEPLADITIARRQGAVTQFYEDMEEKGLYIGKFLVKQVARGRTRPPIDADPLAHTRSGSAAREQSAYSVKRKKRSELVVKPLTGSEWRLVAQELGPLPSEQQKDPRRSRDRLACELAVVSGMRVAEVASVTDLQIMDLYNEWLRLPEYQQQEGGLHLLITETKGSKPRHVEIQAYLVPELMAYIDGERKQAATQGAAYARKQRQSFKQPRALFLNHANAGKNAGKPIQTESLQDAFSRACIQAGLLFTVEKTHPLTKEILLVKEASHVFHDLRHTYAVWKYHQCVANGEPEPWKEVQAFLGHASLETTRTTYLAVVNIDRAKAGKRQYAAKQRYGVAHE